MVLPQFLLPMPAARVGARSVSARKENQMMGKKKNWQLWQCHCRKGEEKKKKVCGNGIAEIEVINFWQLWQWHCRNRGVKKNFWNCEKWNGIRQCHCHNSIPLFFFKEMISAHNFYNIFTTNFKWQVVIVGLKK